MLWALALACTGSDLEPLTVAGSGYEDVTLQVPAGIDLSTLQSARLGPHLGLDPRVDGQSLTLWFQGAPEGTWALELTLSTGERVLEQAIVVEAPIDPVFERVVALGASLTQGVQGGVPSQRGHLVSPSAQLARAVGVHHPLPVLVDPLLPQIGVVDIGEAPACEVPDVAGWVTSAATEVLTTFTDPDSGEFSYALTRLDPELEPFNVGVGNMNLGDYVDGAQSDFVLRFLGHLTYEPNAGFSDPLSETPLERVEALEPTMVLLADTYGNDVIGAVVSGSTLKLSRVTDPEVFEPKAIELFERLAATGAEVFVATLPDPDVLPAAAEKRAGVVREARAAALEAGADPDAAEQSAVDEFDGVLQQIVERADLLRGIVVREVDRHPNVHIVDLHGVLNRVRADGLEVGSDALYPQKLGGLVSTDGVHFSDTGYALVANAFLDTIEQELSLDVPRVDLESVYASDPYAIPALTTSTFDPAACDR